eukprot:TRINITY_DN72761_c0_g1_i1.p2 TRINITY_DN72761_c0_g1~~TRINITY_DN72761_c0_g1_i1.p2  ORF type:complete len:740 (-),score=261.99 TRINITY_DN72761_c0_g1_i1:68-2287(-)
MQSAQATRSASGRRALGALVLALSAERLSAANVGGNRVRGLATTSSTLSPVTRVVQLLKDLSEKVEKEGKAEETLYEKFMCWGKTTVADKKAAISTAQSRADMLDAYIADIDAGRVEFTSERTDLEKELEELNADLEAADALRKKEKSDFEDATAEMDKAIKALRDAIDVLGKATADHKEGTLLALRGELGSATEEGFATRAAAGERLAYAATLGDKFLTKGDAFFLRRLLLGTTADPADRADWKDLNRKATFKMSYKARSFKIQEVLSKLLETFEASKEEATDKENAAIKTHDKLVGTKSTQKTNAEEALVKLEKESGAKGMSRAEASEESSDLKEQISDDNRYIQQTEASMKTKKDEWKTRSELRAGELEAISKAIGILASDDAKDTFKKSFQSHGYAFLQTSASSEKRRRLASEILAAAAGGDRRVEALARTASRGHFDEVITAIDTMVKTLQKEEASELAKKEGCEQDRMKDTRDAVVAARNMDEMTDTVVSLQADIKEIDAEVADKNEQIKKNNEELEKAKRLREDEAAAYAVAKKDDSAAVALVDSAESVLQQFYADNGLMLAQQQQKQGVGQAPVPPPTTWEAPYGGKTGESTGILAVLKMIADDIRKDIQKADDAENAAISDYDEVKSDLEQDNKDLSGAIVTLEGTKSDKENSVETNLGDRKAKGNFLAGVMQKIANAQPGCDYFTINYPVRSKNRQIEVDGLEKAKTILSGGSFATPENAGREMKPGDA